MLPSLTVGAIFSAWIVAGSVVGAGDRGKFESGAEESRIPYPDRDGCSLRSNFALFGYMITGLLQTVTCEFEVVVSRYDVSQCLIAT